MLVVDSSGNLIDSSRCSTPAEGGKELISSVINLIKEFNKKYEIKGIGISIAALISSDYGTIVGAPNIANLSKLNFANEIKEEFNLYLLGSISPFSGTNFLTIKHVQNKLYF